MPFTIMMHFLILSFIVCQMSVTFMVDMLWILLFLCFSANTVLCVVIYLQKNQLYLFGKKLDILETFKSARLSYLNAKCCPRLNWVKRHKWCKIIKQVNKTNYNIFISSSPKIKLSNRTKRFVVNTKWANLTKLLRMKKFANSTSADPETESCTTSNDFPSTCNVTATTSTTTISDESTTTSTVTSTTSSSTATTSTASATTSTTTTPPTTSTTSGSERTTTSTATATTSTTTPPTTSTTTGTFSTPVATPTVTLF